MMMAIMKPQRTSSRQEHNTRSASKQSQLSEGKVGIFWWYRGRLLASAVPIAEGVVSGDIVDSALNHYSHWRLIQQQHPALHRLEYDEVPRGRVVFSKKEVVFSVFMNSKLNRPGVKNSITRAFELDGKNVRFASDSHYSTNRQQINSLFDE